MMVANGRGLGRPLVRILHTLPLCTDASKKLQHPLLRSAEAEAEAEEQRWYCSAAVGMVQQGQPMTVGRGAARSRQRYGPRIVSRCCGGPVS